MQYPQVTRFQKCGILTYREFEKISLPHFSVADCFVPAEKLLPTDSPDTFQIVRHIASEGSPSA